MVFLVGAFGMNFPIFASTMAIEFGQEADGFGLLSSILAIGSLAGALLAARRDRARIRVVIGGTLLFAVAAASLVVHAELLGICRDAHVHRLRGRDDAHDRQRLRADDDRPRAARARARAVHGDPDGRHADRRARSSAGSPPSSAPASRSSSAPPRLSSRSRSARPGCWPPAGCTATNRGASASRSTRRGRSGSSRRSRGLQRTGRHDDADPAAAALFARTG